MIDMILNNISLEKILWVIRKKILIIILMAILGATILGYYKYYNSSALYRARISLYVYSDPSYRYDNSVNVSNSEFVAAKNLVASYMLILGSNTVLEKVSEKIGGQYTSTQLKSMIASEAVSDTAVFYVYIYNSDPYMAQQIVNAVAEIAPDEIARVVKSGGVEVVDYAKLPTSPYASTNILKYTLIGAVIGGAGSTFLFLIFAIRDTKIRSKKELLTHFTIPILGEIPTIYAPSKKEKANKLLTINSPFGIKESYNKVRTNLMFTGRGDKCPVFIITSADPNVGKTMNCVNIAIAFSQLGKKVLIIDGDLRNPSVCKTLGIQEDVLGLSQYLAALSEELHVQPTENENLFTISVGTIPPNPAELLASPRFEDLMIQMKQKFEYIFIDMPPLGLVSDPVLLEHISTGYVLIARCDVSDVLNERKIISQLEQVDAPISGYIYNGVDPKNSDYTYKKGKYEYKYN